MSTAWVLLSHAMGNYLNRKRRIPVLLRAVYLDEITPFSGRGLPHLPHGMMPVPLCPAVKRQLPGPTDRGGVQAEVVSVGEKDSVPGEANRKPLSAFLEAVPTAGTSSG